MCRARGDVAGLKLSVQPLLAKCLYAVQPPELKTSNRAHCRLASSPRRKRQSSQYTLPSRSLQTHGSTEVQIPTTCDAARAWTTYEHEHPVNGVPVRTTNDSAPLLASRTARTDFCLNSTRLKQGNAIRKPSKWDAPRQETWRYTKQ